MSQANYQSVPERALDDVRLEWITEGTPGVTPADPSWNRFGDHVQSAPGYEGDASVEGTHALGNSDTETHFRGSIENTLTISWWMQRFFVDESEDPNDPGGTILARDPGTTLDSHTVAFRREQSSGGNDGAGFRAFTVARGAYPTSLSAPGDPSEAAPIVAEVEYQAADVETHVVHQPSASTTLEVVSSSANDTTQTLTLEDDGAGASEDVSLSGTTAVTTTATFTDLDAATLDARTEGNVTVSDGAGTTLLVLSGSNSDGVKGDLGVPALGGGSHASPIGTDPAEYQFLGTSTTFDGAHSTPTRIHALNLNVEVETSTEAQQGTRQMAIDPGVRTASVEAETAGPFESATRYREYMNGVTGDITYSYPDGDVAVRNAQPTDVDEQTYEAGEANTVFTTTFEGHGNPAVTATPN